MAPLPTNNTPIYAPFFQSTTVMFLGKKNMMRPGDVSTNLSSIDLGFQEAVQGIEDSHLVVDYVSH